MSLNHSPSVVTNGLVMYADMTNTKKSWLGQPTINQFGIPTPDASGNVTFPVQGTGTFQRIYSGTYGGYEIQPTDVVYKYVLGAAPTGCHYHGYTISAVIGQAPTWSFDYYIDPSTTGYPVTNYLANIESSIGVGANLTDPTPTTIGVWKRATQTSAAATSNGTFNAYLYPGACGSQMATGGFILYKNPQVEFNSFATPFVAGTRASTGAIVDLTNNNTLTVSSLTYASDNTFSFDGNSNYLQGNSSCGITSSVTLSAIIKPSYSGQTGPHSTIICTDVSYPYGAKLMNYKNSARYGLWLGFSGVDNYEAFVGTDINNNTIKMLTASWEQSTGIVNIYLNGVLQSSIATAKTIPTVLNDGKITLGTDYNSIGSAAKNKFLGNIYCASVYNRALSAAEVAQNFNALRGRYGI